MFLRPLLNRNRPFVDAAMSLHRDGKIPSNAYVYDLDAIEANSVNFVRTATGLGLTTYAMTKQIGRPAPVLQRLVEAGITSGVAVDMACARALVRGGMSLGHVGHLVQVPTAEADLAASWQPSHWTVFSMDKAREAAAAAGRLGRTQHLLARVHAPGDTFYRGHEGGFTAGDIAQVARDLDSLDHAEFAGVTTFPALLWDQDRKRVAPTPNLATVVAAARATGVEHVVINAPGTTSAHVLPVLAEAGATQVEPGHALTGTTPAHAFSDELPEIPAALYLTEVSHLHEGRPYVFGGGMYVDPVFGDYPVQAAVADTDGALRLVGAELPPATAIDYYGQLEPGAGVTTGSTVVFGFRSQAFVTRAYIVPIAGVASGAPAVAGIFAADGRPAEWV